MNMAPFDTIIYPPGGGGNFISALFRGVLNKEVPPGNEYNCIADSNVIYTHHIVPDDYNPESSLVLYSDNEDVQKRLNRLAIAKNALAPRKNMLNVSYVVWRQNRFNSYCRKWQNVNDIALFVRSAYNEIKEIGHPAVQFGSFMHQQYCLYGSLYPSYSDFLCDMAAGLVTIERTPANGSLLEARWKYPIETVLWEAETQGTILDPYREQIIEWNKRNNEILAKFDEVIPYK